MENLSSNTSKIPHTVSLFGRQIWHSSWKWFTSALIKSSWLLLLLNYLQMESTTQESHFVILVAWLLAWHFLPFSRPWVKVGERNSYWPTGKLSLGLLFPLNLLSLPHPQYWFGKSWGKIVLKMFRWSFNRQVSQTLSDQNHFRLSLVDIKKKTYNHMYAYDSVSLKLMWLFPDDMWHPQPIFHQLGREGKESNTI